MIFKASKFPATNLAPLLGPVQIYASKPAAKKGKSGKGKGKGC